MLSLAEYRAGLCPICGSPKTLCQATENSGRFTVPLPSRCHVTTAIRAKQANPDGEYPHPEALSWSAQLNT